ncbi:MAG: hypothetical protein HY774_23095 [Acidobacteria bacterium]|nr:hypothetical protein [Acidobacteriota bacterium]
MLALIACAFVLLLGVPLVPGLLELRRPQDGKPLAVDPEYSRDPRYFGRQFRAQLLHRLERNPLEPATCSLQDQLLIEPHLKILDTLTLADHSNQSVLLVARRKSTIGEKCLLGDCYFADGVTLGTGTTVTCLAADADTWIGAHCQIDQWIDVEGNLYLKNNCVLGKSATAEGKLQLEEGCHFHRLWGLPIQTTSSKASIPTQKTGLPLPSSIDQAVVWGNRKLSLPKDTILSRDLVVYGDLEIGENSSLFGNIKTHGTLTVGAGVRIEGNIFSRKSMFLGVNSQILGNVFSEKEIYLASGTTVGDTFRQKSVIAAGQIRIEPEVIIFGWVLTEKGGSTE